MDSILEQTETAAKDIQRKFDRLGAKKSCLIETALPHIDEKIKISAETIDYSEGGIGLSYNGSEIPKGTLVSVFIETLDIVNRNARVVWTSVSGELSFRAGLQWV